MSAGPFAHWSIQTTLVWVLGTCVVVVVWYGLFYRATHDEWVRASNDLGAARTELATARRDRDRDRAHALELAAEESTLAAARRGGDDEDLLLVVAPLASELGLEIDRWRPLTDQPAGALVLTRVEVDARGSWPALLELMGRLTALPQVLVVDGLSLRASEGEVLELGLTLGALHHPDPAREAAP